MGIDNSNYERRDPEPNDGGGGAARVSREFGAAVPGNFIYVYVVEMTRECG